jgi:hypothetical protein
MAQFNNLIVSSAVETIEQNGTPVTQRTILNFIGSWFTIVDNPVTMATDLTFPAPVLITGSTMTGLLILSGDPVTGLGAATKQYVDSMSAGLSPRTSCRVASTAALTVTYNNGASGVGATLTNAGAQAALVMDGVTLAVADRVLIKDQAGGNQFQNGIYVVTNIGSGSTNWVLTRATDFNTAAPNGVVEGAYVVISEGTVNATNLFVETGQGPFTIGTTAIIFSAMDSAANITVSAPLTKTGNNIALTTPLSGTYGGTGVNNGASTITIAGNLTTSGAFGSTFTMTNTTSVTFPTSGTLATTSQLPSLPLSLSNGGTGANLTASNGGIFYSNASTGAILSGTATANQVLLSGSSTTPAWSTATYPATTTVNQILYSSSASVIAGLATANSSVLITSGAGVPSLSTTLPSGLAATNLSLTTPVLGTPQSGNLVNCTGYPASAISGQVALANGGTSANLTASNGGIFYSTASAGAILSGTATASQVLLSGASTTPAWSTATYPGTCAQGDIFYGSATNVISALTKSSTATNYLSNTGTSNNPAWAQVNLANGVTGTLPVGNGGTNNTTFTAYSVICAGTTATGAFQNVSGLGSSTQVLTSNGAGALPTWQAAPAGTGSANTMLNYSQAGPTINASLNVTSVTNSSTGRFIINFTSNYADVNYCSSGMIMDNVNTSSNLFLDSVANPTTSTVHMTTVGGSFIQPTFVNVKITAL